jgi:hypothetical protein
MWLYTIVLPAPNPNASIPITTGQTKEIDLDAMQERPKGE